MLEAVGPHVCHPADPEGSQMEALRPTKRLATKWRSCPHLVLIFPAQPSATAWVCRPSGLEAPLPPALKEAGPARGLFWEQLLRSNGLVRATLTFLSWEEGRAGEGAGQPGDLSLTPTGVDEKGASGCFRVGSRNSALARLLTRKLLLFEKTGLLYFFHFSS